jgi:hypothetical protein
MTLTANNDDDNNILDIVGKGLFYSTATDTYENEYLNNNSNDINQQNMQDVFIYSFFFPLLLFSL